MDMAGLFRLDGRTALVTGATRGIGRMIAAGFVGQGARVLVTGRDVDAAAATARRRGGWRSSRWLLWA